MEIYAELDDYELGVAQIKSFLANFRHGTTGYDLESYLYTLLGHQAIEHLFRVCTGLDSMLIGEAEILGQVKDAYVAATRAKSLGNTLHHLFREALDAGKARAHADEHRRRVGLDRNRSGRSSEEPLGNAGSEVGSRRRRRQDGTHGGEAFARRRRGARRRRQSHRLALARSRRRSGLRRGRRVARSHRRARRGRRRRHLDRRRNFVIDARRLGAAMERRPDRPLFIVDIAVPRDVDPDVAELPNVALVDIDGLKSVVDERLETRREAIPHVEEIIAEYVERFDNWYRSRVAVPVISRLTQKAEAIRASRAGAAAGALPRARTSANACSSPA